MKKKNGPKTSDFPNYVKIKSGEIRNLTMKKANISINLKVA